MPRHHTAKRPKSLASNESRTRIDERLSEIRSGMCARCGGSGNEPANVYPQDGQIACLECNGSGKKES